MKTNNKQPIYALGGIVPEDVVASLVEDGLSRSEVVDFFESFAS